MDRCLAGLSGRPLEFETDVARRRSYVERTMTRATRTLSLPLDRQLTLGNPPRRLAAHSALRREGEGTGNGEGTSLEQESSGLPMDVGLDEEQGFLVRRARLPDSFFFTGAAGTGKSTTLLAIIEDARQRLGVNAVGVTAPTGMAACNIGGTTVHSFFGIGIDSMTADTMEADIRANARALQHVLHTEVVVMDEVGLLSAEFLDNLMIAVAAIRGDDKPLGGIQLILCGDFFQISPIRPRLGNLSFAFEATTWKRHIKDCYTLTKVYRQKDEEYVRILQEVRYAELSDFSIRRLSALAEPVYYPDSVEPVELFSIRAYADEANNRRLQALPEAEYTYKALDYVSSGCVRQAQAALKDLAVHRTLRLRAGARVILLKNQANNPMLVNGTSGRILGFMSKTEWIKAGEDFYSTSTLSLRTYQAGRWPVVEFSLSGCAGTQQMLMEPQTWELKANGYTVGRRTQVPLALGWAMSMHKAAGLTLSRVIVDFRHIFDYGQAYTALSRVRTRLNLQILNFGPEAIKAHARVKSWYRRVIRLDQVRAEREGGGGVEGRIHQGERQVGTRSQI